MSKMESSMRCGNCGGRTFTLTEVRDSAADPPCSIHVTCVDCKSTSILAARSTTRLDIDWGENAEGIVCSGWSDDAGREGR